MAKQQSVPPANTQGQGGRTATTPARGLKTAPVRTEGGKRESIFSEGRGEFIFGRQHFILFGVGLLLVLLGLAAMTGGAQPDPNTWDESIIYSPMRITVAPIMILAGFVVVILGIFKKS